uniref:MAP3K TRAFs-binding domain-containing protein n=1 Tax=Romanomermis culicivorax TaxID=13658 RepID=A0A915KU91_ROMCU
MSLVTPTITSSVSTCAIVDSPKTIASVGVHSPLPRSLQVALLMDLTTKEGQAARRMAYDELQRMGEAQNLTLQHIPFEKLDFGETASLDAFYNADVAIVDLSVKYQQSTLCYHLGVRESMNQTYNIVLYNTGESFKDESISQPFKVTFGHYKIILYTLKDDNLTCWDPSQLLPNVVTTTLATAAPMVQATCCNFKNKIKRFLKEVQIDASFVSAHSRDKFLADLRKARQTFEGNNLMEILDKLRTRLDDPAVLSVDTVLKFYLRDIQNYDAMVSLVEDVASLPNCRVSEAAAVKFNYAFALNRRNQGNDRDKALSVMEETLSSQENQVPDMLCLAGRIYKDKFVESNYTNNDARDSAIHWYRKGFEVQPNEYAGINLATLLVIAGNSFQTSAELQQIALMLNSLLGRKGSLANLKDYWDVATFFEISVLAEDYNKACQAARHMFLLKPPSW